MAFFNFEILRLRPIFFAFEDQNNIINLIYETYERLATAATILAGEIVSSRCLWELKDNIMTDAVSKNLKIENGVAKKLGSCHKPRHVLCKSHTVEK